MGQYFCEFFLCCLCVSSWHSFDRVDKYTGIHMHFQTNILILIFLLLLVTFEHDERIGIHIRAVGRISDANIKDLFLTATMKTKDSYISTLLINVGSWLLLWRLLLLLLLLWLLLLMWLMCCWTRYHTSWKGTHWKEIPLLYHIIMPGTMAPHLHERERSKVMHLSQLSQSCGIFSGLRFSLSRRLL